MNLKERFFRFFSRLGSGVLILHGRGFARTVTSEGTVTQEVVQMGDVWVNRVSTPVGDHIVVAKITPGGIKSQRVDFWADPTDPPERNQTP